MSLSAQFLANKMMKFFAPFADGVRKHCYFSTKFAEIKYGTNVVIWFICLFMQIFVFSFSFSHWTNAFGLGTGAIAIVPFVVVRSLSSEPIKFVFIQSFAAFWIIKKYIIVTENWQKFGKSRTFQTVRNIIGTSFCGLFSLAIFALVGDHKYVLTISIKNHFNTGNLINNTQGISACLSMCLNLNIYAKCEFR